METGLNLRNYSDFVCNDKWTNELSADFDFKDCERKIKLLKLILIGDL